MNKITFTDGSYIEKNKSGLVYVGTVANEVGHIIRKTNCTLEQFMKAFNNQILIATNGKKSINN